MVASTERIETVARAICSGDPDMLVQTMHFRDLGELGCVGQMGDPLIPQWHYHTAAAERAIAAIDAQVDK